MESISFDPPICHMVIFSGGGGLLERAAEVALAAGENQLLVRGVPASFDPETFLVTFGAGVSLKEIVIRKPNRRYVEDNLRREGEAAHRLIETSVEIGPRRPAIIDVCEEIAQRTYLDEEVDLTIWLVAPAGGPTRVALSYFVDDARFRWKPTITVELGDNDAEVRVRGFISITNESAHRFADVEVSFADFARELGDDDQNYRAEPTEMKRQMRQQVLRKMMFK